jgi:hypothetical protein
MDELNTLKSLGITLPSPAYLFGALFFGIVGIAAWRYGKKAAQPRVRWIGLILMLYPYAVSETWLLYALGCGLCASLYVFRK